MKNLCTAVFVAAVAMVSSAFGRLGETESELIARFGKPQLRSVHHALSQGRQYELGPTLHFRQDDWRIGCDLVDGRCVRIEYGKTGQWTDEQIQVVLSSNAQGASWTERTAGSGKLAREWRRADGATARWSSIGGMTLITPAYERAKSIAEAKAKAEASRKPKI